jgi:hypothetical protein
MINKRGATRYDCELDVELIVKDVKHTAKTGNLSLGGVLIKTELKLPFGTRLQLRLSIPTQKEPIEAAGAVRWADPGGLGVQFDGLRAKDTWALGKYFESLQASR